MAQMDFCEIATTFSIKGDFLSALPFGSGHINDTYLVTTSSDKYILQKLNHSIFKEIDKMNRNIILALDHLHQNQLASGDFRFHELNVLFCDDGKNHFVDADGNYWRMMDFVADSITFDVAQNPEAAYEAAKAFGYFQKNLLDLNPTDFFPVIPDFHNLQMRLNAFHIVLKENPANRNALAKEELDFVLDHENLSNILTELLQSKQIPIRVTHNDTKINNVLLHKDTHKGIGVVDLDTVMPGTILFDFGDMVRTFTSPAEEDETDLSKVILRTEIFEAMAKGYLSELKGFITDAEVNNLVFGGKIMIFMIGLRFLTDFLQGDVYFKTARENHNLDRCRTQFTLLNELEKQEDSLHKIIHSI